MFRDIYLSAFNFYLPVLGVWIFATIFGLALGSFIACAVYRVPRGISLWSKRRSFCAQCRKDLHWYETIPVLSYVLQRGRCRGCGCQIGVMHPLIELATLILVLFLTVLTLF